MPLVAVEPKGEVDQMSKRIRRVLSGKGLSGGKPDTGIMISEQFGKVAAGWWKACQGPEGLSPHEIVLVPEHCDQPRDGSPMPLSDHGLHCRSGLII